MIEQIHRVVFDFDEKPDDALIANYLGWRLEEKAISFEKQTWIVWGDYIVGLPNGSHVMPPLLFSVSFEWLMGVVLKAEKGNIGFKMCRKRVEVYVDSTKEVLLDIKEDCRLNSLYRAVVEFIKWHNTKYDKSIQG